MASYRIRSWIGKKAGFVCVVVGLALMLSVRSWAFVSQASKSSHNQRDRKAAGQRVRPLISREFRDYEWRKFQKKHGLDWQAVWNSTTGVPHRVMRSSQASTSEGLWKRLFWGPADLEAYVHSFMKENEKLLGLENSEVKLVRITRRGGIWYLDFQQQYQSIPVCGSRVRFEFDEFYRLLTFGADTYPGIALEVTPSIDENEARAIVNQRLQIPSALQNEKNYEVRSMILPQCREEELQYFLVWVVEADSWRYFIDAHSGEILQRYNRSRPVISGRLEGMILPNFYNDVPVRVSMPDQKVYLLNKGESVYQELLDADPGWDTQGLWQFGCPTQVDLHNLLSTPGHAGPPDPDSGYTGVNIYGYNLQGDYTNLMRPKYLTTPVIDCTDRSGVVLRFWRWLGVYKEYTEDDYGTRTNFDRASVEVSCDNGITWSAIWSNSTGQIEDAEYNSLDGRWYGWSLQTFDISKYADNRTVYIRWGMGPTDSSGVFCGWNIDDVEVLESKYTYTDPNGEFSLPTEWTGNTVTAKISGRYVTVYNEDVSDALYVAEDVDANSINNYCWNPTSLASYGYDELNVYYHINRMIRHIKSIDPEYEGMDPDRKGPIKVFVRWGENYNNAFWSSDHYICFGEGDNREDGYRNFALFADVIYHEYTHGVTESFYSYFMPLLSLLPLNTTSTDSTEGPVLTTELDAMHEAFSDYWAATLTNDPFIGNGDIWIGHSYIRKLENTYHYPDDYGDDPYANSLILSGAMWEVRQAFGQEVADTLFHFARYGGDTTFSDFLASVLSQDRQAYGGAHEDDLKQIFGNRGISKAPAPPTRLIATPGNTIITLTWEPVSDPDVVGYYVYYRTENDIETSREDPSVRRDAANITTYVVEGLSNETTYVLKTTAYDIYGTESEYSDYVYSTPYDPTKNPRYFTGSSDEDDTSPYLGGLCFLGAIRAEK